jgi:hypothetical protein
MWRGKIDGVVVIVGGQHRPENAPDWVCLSCQPSWSEVHRLALKEEECQLKMEEYVAAMDFVSGTHWRDQKRAVQQQLRELLGLLLDHQD